MPTAITPMAPEACAGISNRLYPDSSAHAAISGCLATSEAYWRFALPGSSTQRVRSSSGESGFCGSGLPVRTAAREWARRVTSRRSTGSRSASESAKASAIMSKASCWSDGSRMGTIANLP